MKRILRLLVLAVFAVLASFLIGVGIVASIFWVPIVAGYEWGMHRVFMRLTRAAQSEIQKAQVRIAEIRSRCGPPDDVQ